MIVIDYSHMSFRMLHTSLKQFENNNFAFFRHIFLTSLYSLVAEFQDNKIVLAVDLGSWRKKFYEDYKAHRKEERQKSSINFEEFFDFSRQFIQELESIFPLAVVKVKWAEADDIFGTIAMNVSQIKTLEQGEKIVFVSSDKDMQQVKLHCDCIVYDPIKKIEILQGATQQTLEFNHLLKIILGDKGDNISNVQKGVGEKTAAKIIKEGTVEEWLDNEAGRREIFNRNKKLICFTQIPKTLQAAIVDEVNTSFVIAQKKINSDLNIHMRHYYKENALMRLNESVDTHVNLFARKLNQQIENYNIEQIVSDILGDSMNVRQ